MNQNAQDILKLADNMLATRGIPRIHAPDVNSTPQQRLGNLRWRIDRVLFPQTDAEKMLAGDEVALGRFVGFVQGVLYDAELLSLAAIDDQAQAIRSGFNPTKEAPADAVGNAVDGAHVVVMDVVMVEPTSPLLPKSPLLPEGE